MARENQQHRLADLHICPLGEGRDNPIWMLSKNGFFTVNSLYKKLTDVGLNRSFKHF
jgi:hypothetical protein